MRTTLTCLATLLAGCSGPPPKPTPPPLPPITLEAPRVGGKVFHELVFTPTRAYPGLRLEYSLLDQAGNVVKKDRLDVGAIFDEDRPLVAGREVAARIVRPEDKIKIVGKPRPRSPLDPPPLDLAQIHGARLRSALACHREEWEWQPGKTLPRELEVDEMPEPGTVFLRNVCPPGRELRKDSVRRTFHYRRRSDPKLAWVDLRVTYNIAYPKGVTYRVLLLDERGAPVTRPGCSLELTQPSVVAGTISDYRIELSGEAGARRARRVKRARIEGVQEGMGADQPAVRQVCK